MSALDRYVVNDASRRGIAVTPKRVKDKAVETNADFVGCATATLEASAHGKVRDRLIVELE